MHRSITALPLHGFPWRMRIALLVSVLVHAMFLSLSVGSGFGLPGFRFPWEERRLGAHELRVVLAEPPPVLPSPVIEDAAPVAAPAPVPLPAPAPRLARPATETSVSTFRQADTPRVVDMPSSQPDDAEQRRVEQEARERERLLALARQEAANNEAARVEAEQKEMQRQEQLRLAQQEAARQELARQEAVKKEAARVEAERQELARQETQRQESARREHERAEAARLEAERKEMQRHEQLRQAQLEAARREAARQELARQEAAKQELARQAQLEAARREKARQEQALQEQAQLEVAKRDQAQRERAEQEAKREERLRAIGRQLDQEAAQRDAANRSPGVSGLRRGWLFGRADPNADLVQYALAMGRKIEFNQTFDTVRELVKQPHVRPVVTVAVRADGSVEKVTFVTSSGVPALDEAVRKVIASQAPYGPFPPALARQYDVIEIRRTWIFDSAIRLE
ncbi:TonB C-terminal domain-containing protein [Massilia sp. IC2-476]|uniref:TonB C-terminal domain-containing protein n=1 Tax=Massilia sp. IC2-476 TaxID=2887199 RepID=UPI001D0FF77D|nr:TonB C-terminal domain-containing protein [Massilia sp. IC2-476]MCC2971025.1 TonB C-terminal domain-containing protein [Massilia sp. IC2-476]